MMLPRVVTYAGALDARTAYIFNVYGRLKPGVSREQAEAQLQPLYVAELEQDVAAMGRSGLRAIAGGRAGSCWKTAIAERRRFAGISRRR